MDLAVIILTFNEEANLPAALDSVCGWASEIYVVDSYSTDRTVDIALERSAEGVRVVQHAFENYSRQWNWALSHLPIRAGWTLKLDADERATEQFRREVEAATGAAPAEVEGMYFRRMFFFMGQALRWGGVSSNYVMHLWRTGRAVFENRSVNEHAMVQGRTRKLSALVEHHDSRSIADWIDKHNRYSSMEALNAINGNLTGQLAPRLFGSPDERRIWLRQVFWLVPARHVMYFLFRYVARLGCLDGRPGFRYCFLRASYRYWTELKLIEYRLRGSTPKVVWPERGKPHPALSHDVLKPNDLRANTRAA